MAGREYPIEDFWRDPLRVWAFRVALGLAGNEADAEDLLQKTYDEKLSKPGIRAANKSYVLRAIRWCWFNEHKRKKREKETLQQLLNEGLLLPVASFRHSKQVKDAEEAVAALLSVLPAIYKDVLVTRFLLDPPLSVVETASLLGITPSAVKQRTRRGLQKARQLLV